MPRGRPSNIDPTKLIEIVSNNKNKIIVQDVNGLSVFVPQKNSVWSEICNELDQQIKPATLYSYIVNNRFNLKSIISGDKDIEFSSGTNESSEVNVIKDDLDNEINFILSLKKTEFLKMILETKREYRDRKGIRRTRTVNILHPKKWTEIVTKRIFDEYRLPHGYHFTTSYLSRDNSGRFEGTTK